MKREEFEKICADNLNKFKQLLTQAINGVPKDLIKGLHSVERVGGGMRMPCLERIASQVFNVKAISKTQEASESVARGCAIQAAALSPLFKVPQFVVKERLSEPVSISIQYKGEQPNEKILFDTKCDLEKNVSLLLMKNTDIELSLKVPSNLPIKKIPIAEATLETFQQKELQFEGKIYF